MNLFLSHFNTYTLYRFRDFSMSCCQYKLISAQVCQSEMKQKLRHTFFKLVVVLWIAKNDYDYLLINIIDFYRLTAKDWVCFIYNSFIFIDSIYRINLIWCLITALFVVQPDYIIVATDEYLKNFYFMVSIRVFLITLVWNLKVNWIEMLYYSLKDYFRITFIFVSLVSLLTFILFHFLGKYP